MAFRKRREVLRSILSGSACIRPGSVYDATSIRIASDLGFELGKFGGSVASLAVLGDPDIALITLTELAEQMRRMSRAAELPVLVDADHGYGNALNVRRTIEELETAGAAGLTLAAGIVRPGRARRIDALTANAARALTLMLGVAGLLVVAGTIEGFVSPQRLSIDVRFAIGALTALALAGYLAFAGREARVTADRAS